MKHIMLASVSAAVVFSLFIFTSTSAHAFVLNEPGGGGDGISGASGEETQSGDTETPTPGGGGGSDYYQSRPYLLKQQSHGGGGTGGVVPQGETQAPTQQEQTQPGGLQGAQ